MEKSQKIDKINTTKSDDNEIKYEVELEQKVKEIEYINIYWDEWRS